MKIRIKDEDQKSATSTNNEHKNRDMKILASNKHRPFLMTQVPGRTNYINAVFTKVFCIVHSHNNITFSYNIIPVLSHNGIVLHVEKCAKRKISCCHYKAFTLTQMNGLTSLTKCNFNFSATWILNIILKRYNT